MLKPPRKVRKVRLPRSRKVSSLGCGAAMLECYFGPGVQLLPESDLEGPRIPHFCRAFYVYTHATKLSAAVAPADRVLSGGPNGRPVVLGG